MMHRIRMNCHSMKETLLKSLKKVSTLLSAFKTLEYSVTNSDMNHFSMLNLFSSNFFSYLYSILTSAELYSQIVGDYYINDNSIPVPVSLYSILTTLHMLLHGREWYLPYHLPDKSVHKYI